MTKKVTLYTKSTCPFCVNAVKLLSYEGVEFIEHNYLALTETELTALKEKTNNFRTVPQIFVGDVFVGGFDQLNKLYKNGQLKEMLNT